MANDKTHAHCWSSLPVYRPKTGLTAEQLNASQDDAQVRTRILNLGMNGVGIAHGYELKTDDKGLLVVKDGSIYIGCGLGFDKYGRMLYWKGGWVCLDDILGCKPEKPGSYCLSVHYAERSGHGRAYDPCHEGTEWISTCVGFTLECECCDDQPCLPDIEPEGCIERWEYICQRNGFVPPDEIEKDAELAEACQDPPQLELNHCGKVGYDPKAGQPLACVELCEVDDKDCHPPVEFCCDSEVTSCRKRKVAYRNKLLYELLSRRDVPLSKVNYYAWSDYEVSEWSDDDRMPFEDFAKRSVACHRPGFDPEDAFTICFSRPLLRRTLHPMSVIMDIYIQQERPYYWVAHRVPVKILHLDKNKCVIPEDDDEECAWGVVICPDKLWIAHEIADPASSILDCSNRGYLARVEFMLHCNLIQDKCCRMPDARPGWVDEKDPCGDRAGQAMPGGTWRSAVRLSKQQKDYRADCDDAYERYDPPKREPYPDDSKPDPYADKTPDPGKEDEKDPQKYNRSQDAGRGPDSDLIDPDLILG